MKTSFKTLAAGIAALFTLGATAAFAEYKPDYCAASHDHRSHASNYYNHYDADRYSRAGAYRNQGVSFSITIGDNGYDNYDRRDRNYSNDRRRNHDRYDRRDRRDYGRRNGYRGDKARIVNREVFDTRYRARIVLIEEVVRTRRGPRLVCTVKVKGPESRYVSKRRMHKIANRGCSRNARIQVFA